MIEVEDGDKKKAMRKLRVPTISHVIDDRLAFKLVSTGAFFAVALLSWPGRKIFRLLSHSL